MDRHEKTYRAWRNMWSRCTNPNDRRRRNYAGRNIKICDRWKSYELFLKDMGEAPDYFFLDRIDNDGNYEPKNCRWATEAVHRRNRTKKYISRHLVEIFHNNWYICWENYE